MDIYRIAGGKTLEGEVTLPPAKNSILPLMAAALLCGGAVTLRGVPDTADIRTSMALIEAIGGTAKRDEAGVTIQPVSPRKAVCRMRWPGRCGARYSIWRRCCIGLDG